jgi:hypothetical protein
VTGTPQPPAPKPRSSRWLNWLGIALAALLGYGIWSGRSSETPVPKPVPPPAATASTPPRPAPTPDPFQVALNKAVAVPERRIAAGDKDWVRVLGPVTGRPGCQFAEMSNAGKTINVIACRDGERGGWRY